MKSKLTLTLDKDVIKKAKEYAATQERSLSNLVESYLKYW
jgi:predicted HicB family RNase H-like nuclease